MHCYCEGFKTVPNHHFYLLYLLLPHDKALHIPRWHNTMYEFNAQITKAFKKYSKIHMNL